MSDVMGHRRSTDAPGEQTPFELCVRPLLEALEWGGTERQIKEAMPHFRHIYTPESFCEVFKHLKFSYEPTSAHLDRIDERLLPCLFVTEDGLPLILISESSKALTVYDPRAQKIVSISRSAFDERLKKGTAFIFRMEDAKKKRIEKRSSWIYFLFKHNRGLVMQAMFLSLVLSVLALATPLYIMFVYDKVISAASVSMLSQFSMGIIMVYIGVTIIHQLRGKIISVLGARLDHEVGNTIFQKILYLAPSYTETATVGSQVARVRDFDRLRDFLTGPLLTIIFDMPFVVVTLTLIAVLGGTLVFVPLTMMAIFIVLFFIAKPKIAYHIQRAARKGSELQEFLLEAISNMKALKYTAAEDKWVKRYRDLSADSSIASLELTMMSQVNNAVSNAIMIAAGMAILSFGAIKIIHGNMSVGAMVAIMILIWRILGPIKTMYNTLPRLIQIWSSFRQVHRLMEIQTESEPGEEIFIKPQAFKGNVSFERVSFRYPTAYNPALVGVTFNIPPGKSVGIIGRNGSGKSTIMKLLLGMYQPQAGSIRIDNQDIRQVNPIGLRKAIAYLPQAPELFYGSIAANLRLADPSATDEMLLVAADHAGILDDILALPDKFDTQIRDYSASRLASSFQQGLCLARAYLKNAPIVLLDEPANVLDFKADQRLLQSINRMKGKSTILMITHRPSHLKQMDMIFLFDQGQLLIQGPPETVLPQVPKELL